METTLLRIQLPQTVQFFCNEYWISGTYRCVV